MSSRGMTLARVASRLCYLGGTGVGPMNSIYFGRDVIRLRIRPDVWAAAISSHDPSSRSSVLLVGIIRAQ